MAPSNQTTLPLIPLAKDSVLLPGITFRIPVSASRPDIPALLSHIYSRATNKTHRKSDNTMVVGCVPLNSALLSRDGHKLITRDDEFSPRERQEIDPARAKKQDLFEFGTVAKVSGVEGRGTGEFALLVEGICRFKVEKITQERPFFEAQVSHFHDEGESVSLVSGCLLSCSSDSTPRRCNSRPLCTSKAALPGASNHASHSV